MIFSPAVAGSACLSIYLVLANVDSHLKPETQVSQLLFFKCFWGTGGRPKGVISFHAAFSRPAISLCYLNFAPDRLGAGQNLPSVCSLSGYEGVLPACPSPFEKLHKP